MKVLENRALLAAVVLGISLLLSAYTGSGRPAYETLLFDMDRVHTVDVQISEVDWQDLLAHPEEKTKYETDVTIDGERIHAFLEGEASPRAAGGFGSELLYIDDETGSYPDIFENADRVHELIRPYLAADPTAFYTLEETDQAYEALRELLLLRAESVRRQLNGTLSPETDRQIPTRRVEASVIDMTGLGSIIIGK